MCNGKFEWKDFTAKNSDDTYKISTSTDLDNYIKYRKSAEKIDKYKNNRAYFHDTFFHYTSLENINKILKSKKILCTKYGDSNDLSEINPDDCVFHLCFSTGKYENIPMWYLYSGTDGKGGSLIFKKSLIYDLINDNKYCLMLRNNSTDEFDEKCDLEPEKDFSLQIQDVIYSVQENNHYTLKYNNRLRKFDKDEFEKFIADNKYFVKSLAWYYEKETRILVKLTDSGICKLKEIKKELKINNDSEFAIGINIDNKNILKNMQLKLGPEYSLDDDNKKISTEKIFEKFKEYEYIHKWLCSVSNYSPSDYTGQIKINLCKKCKKGGDTK